MVRHIRVLPCHRHGIKLANSTHDMQAPPQVFMHLAVCERDVLHATIRTQHDASYRNILGSPHAFY